MFFNIEMDECMESEISAGQKYSAWVPEVPTPSCLCSVITLSEETYKWCQSDCSIVFFFLVKYYTNWIYVKEVILSNYFLLRVPENPFHAITLKYSMDIRVKLPKRQQYIFVKSNSNKIYTADSKLQFVIFIDD